MNIVEAIKDAKLFAPWFRGDSWLGWIAYLKALFVLPMDEAELLMYRQCTGRITPPATPVKESWLIVGRRGGKSLIIALVGVFLAVFRDYDKYLAPGETGYVVIVATDRQQAGIIFNYARALVENIPMIAGLVTKISTDEIYFNNNICISVQTCSHRSIRGRTIIAALFDEVAFWLDETSKRPDTEVFNSVKPGTLSIPNALIIGGSTPYKPSGLLYQKYEKHYGKENSTILVWKAATRTMNATVPEADINLALQEDPDATRAEFFAEFRSDLETYVSPDAVTNCVDQGVTERGYNNRLAYYAFVDPAGGSGKDSFTLAVGHQLDGVAYLDFIAERKPPFSPEQTCAEFASILRRYRISTVQGDRYAGEWPREQFRKFGIAYRVSDKTRSEIYLNLLPHINSERVRLLDNEKLVSQICSLERRTSRSGKDSIDHPVGGHDDVANAAGGVLVALIKPKPTVRLVDIKGTAYGGDWFDFI